MDVACAWQVWHLATSTFTLASSPWHLLTSTFVLRGERGTYGTGLALVARLVPVGRPGRHGTLPGRRGTWRHGQSICGTGVALGDMDVACAWQVWHLATSTFTLASSPWHLLTSTFVLRGKRGTLWYWAGSGGALGPGWSPRAPRHFAWQAWYLATWTVHLRDRRGTWRHGCSMCVAGVALGDIHLHFGIVAVALAHINLRFAWQAWHLWYWAGSGGALGPGWSPRAPRHFAVALAHINLRFAWQAWHLWYWAGSGGALGPGWSPRAPRHFAWQAWYLATWTVHLRDRRGTWRHGCSMCVAGVALGDIHLHFGIVAVALAHINLRFAWQAWHLWYWAGSSGAPLVGQGAAALGVAGRDVLFPLYLDISTFVGT